MNPPLRTAEDNAALLDAFKAGVFDLLATDHAPHTPFEKAQDFTSAPNGITGMDTALVSMFDRYISRGELTWDILVKRYSAEPRRLMGLEPVPVAEGKFAEFLLFDPEGSTTFTADFMKSKSRNTPFLDQTLKGSVDLVVRGTEVLLER
jgi:dihydroorotase